MDEWFIIPSTASSHSKSPSIEYIDTVGLLKNTDVTLELIQNSDYFGVIDAVDGVIALAWEPDESESHKRMVFRFGSLEQEIKDILYEHDLILEFEKKVVYEK